MFMAIASGPYMNFISGARPGAGAAIVWKPIRSVASIRFEHVISWTGQLRRAAIWQTPEVLPDPVGPDKHGVAHRLR